MMLLVGLMAILLPQGVAQNNADVLILGAGTAGLTAAKHLAERNISFLIIEGANEIGGRVRSTMFGGKMVEIGSPALYGTNVKDYVNKFNITGNYTNVEDLSMRTSEGTQPETEATAAWGRLIQSQTKIMEMYGKIKRGKIPDMSLRVALEYANWFPKSPIDDIIEIYSYDSFISDVPELSSTIGFYSAAPFQPNAFVSTDQQGLQNVIVRYTRDFMEVNGPRLKLNEVVDRISHNGSSVSVSTQTGKTFTGKYAIITFSMGVMKSRSVTFEPALPDWKMDTIYKTTMLARTLVYVKFGSGTQRFWDNTQFTIHASSRRGYYPLIWNMEAQGFLPEGTNMIVFLTVGEEARRIERLNKTTVKAEITNVFRNMYGAGTPEPEDILVTKWLDDPLALGSTCRRQVGDNNPRFMEALTSPVGSLYFAGEAYPDTLDGFTEGARLSAVTTATKLHDCMANKKCHQFDPNPAKPPPPTCGATRHSTLTCFVAIFLVVLSIL